MLLGGRPIDERRKFVNRLTNRTPPLVIAARHGHTDVVHYLVECGADVNSTGEVKFDGETIDGAPAVWAAAAGGHLDATKKLVELGANVNQATKTNSTALRGACFDGHLEIGESFSASFYGLLFQSNTCSSTVLTWKSPTDTTTLL